MSNDQADGTRVHACGAIPHGETSLRVSVLTGKSVVRGKAGDWVQAHKTVGALREMGVKAHHYAFENAGPIARDILACEPLDGGPPALEADVIHFIPAARGGVANALASRLKPHQVLAGSTVYWNSVKHQWVSAMNSWRGNYRNLIQYVARCVLCTVGLRAHHFSCYDLLLPNTQAEAQAVRNRCQLKSSALMLPVPNAISMLPQLPQQIPVPPALVSDGYVIYPGVFAPRKNQLGFIRSARDLPYPVVFMGGAVGGSKDCEAYFNRCKKAAPAHWIFLGAVNHESPEFYSFMSHARVACLASSCETPGIALLEAAALGVRPVITQEGGTSEYYGLDAEYLDPTRASSIRESLRRGWLRGRLPDHRAHAYRQLTWQMTATATLEAYLLCRRAKGL